MKKRLYVGGLVLSMFGFAVSVGVFAATLTGADPSETVPWIWRMQPLALVTFGLMFLAPGVFALRDKAEDPRPAQDRQARRWATSFNVLLLAVALANFAFVLRDRGEMTPPANAEERARAYPVSRQYTLRSYSGFWLVFFGVPLAGFVVLLRESGPGATQAEAA